MKRPKALESDALMNLELVLWFPRVVGPLLRVVLGMGRAPH